MLCMRVIQSFWDESKGKLTDFCNIKGLSKKYNAYLVYEGKREIVISKNMLRGEVQREKHCFTEQIFIKITLQIRVSIML